MNSAPSFDWHSTLAGFAVASILIGFALAFDKLTRFQFALAAAIFAICITEIDALDPYAFLAGFVICGFVPLIMLLGRFFNE